MSEIYLTSDQHFYHKNILMYQSATRPFAPDAVIEMKRIKSKIKNENIDIRKDIVLAGELTEAKKAIMVGVNEMNETIIEKHNAIVKPEDDIYMLGDFAFTNPHKIEAILKRLNGNKYFVYGNHDGSMKNPHIEGYFKWMKEYAEIKVDGKNCVLFHYPIHSWNKMHHGSYQFYGHTHGQIPNLYHGRSMDVGVDTNDCYPYNIRDIFESYAKVEAESDDEDFHNDPRGRGGEKR